MPAGNPGYPRKKRGFERASHLVQPQIRKVGVARGFAVTRLLTHWAEIVGERWAKVARPVKIGYGQEGFGATLTVLTTGAEAPMLQADLPKIRERVNACYGYAAIARIRITQTAPTGFFEGAAQFDPAPQAEPRQPDAGARLKAREAAGGVENESLRAALEALGANVITKSKIKRD